MGKYFILPSLFSLSSDSIPTLLATVVYSELLFPPFLLVMMSCSVESSFSVSLSCGVPFPLFLKVGEFLVCN